MKVISKNAELVVLLVIIFFIFFTLAVLYENKITQLKENMIQDSNCISEESLYFQANDINKYIVYITFEKKIAEGYIKVQYENNDVVLELDAVLVDSLIEKSIYKITIENTSILNVIKNDLQQLINVNTIIAVEREV